MEQKKHNIQISDRLYRDIKSYCDVNGLKVSEYVEKLLRHEFTVDCYGLIPSIFIKEETEEAEKTLGDIIENVGGPEVYEKIIGECIWDEPLKPLPDLKTTVMADPPPKKGVEIPKVVEVPELINETAVVNKPKKKKTSGESALETPPTEELAKSKRKRKPKSNS